MLSFLIVNRVMSVSVISWILFKNKFLIYVPLQCFLLNHFIIAPLLLPALFEDCCCSRIERFVVSWNKNNAFVNQTRGCTATSNIRLSISHGAFRGIAVRGMPSYLFRCRMLFLAIGWPLAAGKCGDIMVIIPFALSSLEPKRKFQNSKSG